MPRSTASKCQHVNHRVMVWLLIGERLERRRETRLVEQGPLSSSAQNTAPMNNHLFTALSGLQGRASTRCEEREAHEQLCISGREIRGCTEIDTDWKRLQISGFLSIRKDRRTRTNVPHF